MTRTARRAATVLLLLAGLLAIALPASAGHSWAATTGRSWASAPTSPACAPANRAVLSHTFTGRTMTVTVKEGVRLCQPLTVTLASYRYTGPGQWPQRLADNQTLTFDHGTALLRTPELCGQQDGYLGSAPAVLSGPGSNGEPRFVHEVSAGPRTYQHQAPASCLPPVVTPTPTVPAPTPTAVVPPAPTVAAPVPAVPVPAVSQTAPRPSVPQRAAQPVPAPVLEELPRTGVDAGWLVVIALLLLGGGVLLTLTVHDRRDPRRSRG